MVVGMVELWIGDVVDAGDNVGVLGRVKVAVAVDGESPKSGIAQALRRKRVITTMDFFMRVISTSCKEQNYSPAQRLALPAGGEKKA